MRVRRASPGSGNGKRGLDRVVRDTIYALSTGHGVAAIAVIRLSGPMSFAACRSLAGDCPPPRQATLRALRAPGGDLIDRGLVLTFPAPDSFTGEDCVEFHLHGGRAVVAAMLDALSLCQGLRAAAAGEFTRRAFLNGKLDLTEVEGLADLLAAETDRQRRQALDQAGGRLRALYEGWRRQLIEVAALVTAEIDFVDEDDIPDDLGERIAPRLDRLIAEMGAHLKTAEIGERVRDGFTVVITGPPNAGKSSLLNALAGRDAAIVSEIAGTTRDLIEVHLDLDGFPVMLVDTAGLRAARDAIESEGIHRARARAEAADLVLWLSPDADSDGLDALDDSEAVPLLVRSKSDLAADQPIPEGWLALSSVTGAGMNGLLARIKERLEIGDRVSGGTAMMTRARHRSAVIRAIDCLMATRRMDVAADPELVAEALREAGDCMARLTGRVDVEDLLDVVFRDFCIGK